HMSMDEVLDGTDLIVESVTTTGLRPVLTKFCDQIKATGKPFVLTSKGIEQKSGKLLHEIAEELLGEEYHKKIGCISGPSLADEVLKKQPTTVVCSGFDRDVMLEIQEAFNTPYFRVYPNADISGVEFGGAMKNIIAIACGIVDGLGFGGNTKAALMTRGLHEMRKLAVAKGCLSETVNGLAGMGDLCVTCLSILSRNYRFGSLIAQGMTPEQAKEKIGMVVEGANTCVSACELGEKLSVPLPISEAVRKIIYEGLDPRDAVGELFTRAIKEEHL
ncbi:MAG: NAD(P)-dependent glycerol-3-phosphate dehydrogenase, partial [Simkaniaceae bacterium]|nr:NAD(P)-dependent glycerol-3-phosphate dehydrogenase [Simkaniaceae bacterium]